MKSDSFINDKFTIDELFKRSLKYQKSEAFFKFVKFISRFRHYSRYNSLLVYLQDEKVQLFGGVSFWKRFNRTVSRDARPYIILAPMSPVMMVYDVMQTEGEDSPEVFLEKGAGGKPFSVEGHINPKTLEYAIDKAKSWNIPVRYKPLSFFNAAYVTTIKRQYLEICIKEGMSTEQNLSILIHELAHLFLGHTGHKEIGYESTNTRIRLPNRGYSIVTAQELEAETVSYLISKKLGLETQAVEYLAGYITCDDDLKQFSYEMVVKVADKIDKLFVKEYH